MDRTENIAAILALARRKLNEGKPSFALQAVSVESCINSWTRPTYPHTSLTLRFTPSICNDSANEDEFSRVSLYQTNGAWWLFEHITVAELNSMLE